MASDVLNVMGKLRPFHTLKCCSNLGFYLFLAKMSRLRKPRGTNLFNGENALSGFNTTSLLFLSFNFGPFFTRNQEKKNYVQCSPTEPSLQSQQPGAIFDTSISSRQRHRFLFLFASAETEFSLKQAEENNS